MHPSEYFLNRKKTVCNHAEKERRNNSTDGARHISQVNHIPHAMTLHVISAGSIPCTPDKELQKHHDAEAGLRVSKHGGRMGSQLSQHGLLYQLFHILKGNTGSMIHFFDAGQLVIFDHRQTIF
jgi:hypothetical protein